MFNISINQLFIYKVYRIPPGTLAPSYKSTYKTDKHTDIEKCKTTIDMLLMWDAEITHITHINTWTAVHRKLQYKMSSFTMHIS